MDTTNLRNESETKRNEMKRNETKYNETKRNTTKRNENEETKRNETKWSWQTYNRSSARGIIPLNYFSIAVCFKFEQGSIAVYRWKCCGS
jgi:hypothetical protein